MKQEQIDISPFIKRDKWVTEDDLTLLISIILISG